jgi:hypothetical protein
MHGTLKDLTQPAPNALSGAAKVRTNYQAEELAWGGLTLRLGRGRVVASVEPDSKWSGMWRVRCGRQLSDMVNLTRAKDAAVSIALSQLNSAKEAVA